MNQKMNVETGIITLNSNDVSEIDHKSTTSDYESSGNNILNEFSQIQVQDLQLQTKMEKTYYYLFFPLSTTKTLDITY